MMWININVEGSFPWMSEDMDAIDLIMWVIERTRWIKDDIRMWELYEFWNWLWIKISNE